jgi:hypothetical protein
MSRSSWPCYTAGGKLPFEFSNNRHFSTKNAERRWGDSNTMPIGTLRLAVELGANTDSHLQFGYLGPSSPKSVFRAKLHLRRKEDSNPKPITGSHCFRNRPDPRSVHSPKRRAEESNLAAFTAVRFQNGAESTLGILFNYNSSRRKEESNLTPRGAHCFPSRPDP